MENKDKSIEMNDEKWVIFTQEADGEVIAAKFRIKVPFLVWKNVFKYIYLNDSYNAARTLLINQYVKEKGKLDITSDEGYVYLFIADIMEYFMKFSNVVLYKEDGTDEFKKVQSKYPDKLYTLEIGPHKFYLRGLQTKEYSDIFNKMVTDPLSAWEYVYKNLIVEKSVELEKESVEFISAHTIPAQLMNIKQNTIKKK